MNPQRNFGPLPNQSSSYQRQILSVSQIQNSSTISIKPLAYPCRYHPDQICLNYCIEPKCFQALCSECIEEHLLHHKKVGLNDLYVKSFKSVRSECSSKLIKIIDKLLSKLMILNQPKNPQEMLEDSDRQLQNIRLLMHEIIDQEFGKIRQAIKNKVSQNFSTVKDLNEIHQNLIKIINQLKEHNNIISQGILDHPVNVGDSIEKTLLLNESALLEMFEKESWKYDQKFKNINVQIIFSEADFRQSTINSLKIGSGKSINGTFKGPVNSRLSQFGQVLSDDFNGRLRSRSKSPINEKVNESNYGGKNLFSVNYPVLHYFQTGQNILHLIDLKGEPQRTAVPLANFKVPAFHASILSQKTGSIFIAGGNLAIPQIVRKSSSLSKYSLISNEFKKEFAQVKPRSSHVLCEDCYTDNLYILGGYGQNSGLDQDQSNATFETAVQKVNIKNGNVEEVCPSHFGGACMAVLLKTFIVKACMEGIEIYDSINNFWSEVSNLKPPHLDTIFCRGVGYSILNSNILLIYGGYDENQQNKKQSYLMSMSINSESPIDSSVEVQKLNSPLPIAEGFWNNPGIIYQQNIWAIQNVEDQEGEPIESERTLIKMDIESKKWSIVKTKKK